MLGKLIKHEWKSLYKMGCLMLGAMAFVTFLGWLAFQAPVWNGHSSSWLDIFSFLTLMIYVMLLVCVNFGTIIYLGVHFYRTMYTDEGYLTHTLPVTKHQILISKIFVSGLWTMIILLTIYLSVFLLGLSSIIALVPYDMSFAELLDGIGRFLVELELELDFDGVRLLVTGALITLTGPFLTMTILFGAISLGQLASKGRLLMGVLYYIVIVVLEQLVTALLRSFAGSLGMYVNINLDSGFAVNLVTAAALYMVTHFVISRRLNLV